MDLVISARSVGARDTIHIVYVPYDKESQERLLDHQREIHLPLWETVASVPEAAAAFAAIAAAVPVLVQFYDQKMAAAAVVLPGAALPQNPTPVDDTPDDTPVDDTPDDNPDDNLVDDDETPPG